MTVPDDRQSAPRGDHEAALDIGANTLVACTTTTGHQYRYDGEPLFEQFRETSEHIASLRAKLPDGQHSSKRIDRLYRKRTRRRDHAVNALVRDLVSRLHGLGVARIYIGDLSAPFDSLQSAIGNEKVHNFWSYWKFASQLQNVSEEYGLEVTTTSEAWTSQECPECGRRDTTVRHRETLTCSCGFDGHADLAASRTLLSRNTDFQQVGSTARPVRFQWDNHEWRSVTDAQANPNE